MRPPVPIFRDRGRFVAIRFTAAIFLFSLLSSASTKFYDDDPLWEEVNSQDASRVKFYEPQLIYDVAENMFARPGDKDFDRRAQNVNTVDEVPDGSWFTNRTGRRALTPEQVARGSNTGHGPSPGKWAVIAAKSDGVTPGFTIRDSSGLVWFLKFDPPGYRGMATGTEVVVAKLFWALGYHITEYYISQLRPSDLIIDQSAVFTPPSGIKRAMHLSDINTLLKEVEGDPDGTYRVIASLSIPGKMVGRIRFYGTRPDDPNDLVSHENHRELRGYGVFAAWFNHAEEECSATIRPPSPWRTAPLASLAVPRSSTFSEGSQKYLLRADVGKPRESPCPVPVVPSAIVCVLPSFILLAIQLVGPAHRLPRPAAPAQAVDTAD